jgi:hypothetical protein
VVCQWGGSDVHRAEPGVLVGMIRGWVGLW